MVRRPLFFVALVAFGLAVVVACGSDGSAIIDRAELSAACYIDSNCRTPLRCAFKSCHVECAESRDCSPGERCVTAERPFNVCQRADEAKCNYNSECAGAQRCAADHKCRDQCAGNIDCVSGQVCVTGACAEPGELVNGALPVQGTPLANVGQACLRPSDCVVPLVCTGHTCNTECAEDRDCDYGRVCVDTKCQISTGSGTIIAGVCEHKSDCPAPLACLFQQCTYECINGRDCDGVPCVDHVCAGTRSSSDGGNDAGDSGIMGVDAGDGGATLFADVTSLAAGDHFTCEVHATTNGVKCWGSNASGELGAGNISPRGAMPGEMGAMLPTLNLGAGRTALAVAAKGSFACALLDNHSVKCWGANGSGQLGQGDTSTRGDAPGEMGDALLPIDLGPGRTAVQVAAGLTHACAILDNGSLKCWGGNGFGELGLGDTNNRGDGPGEMGALLLPVSLGMGRTAIDVSCNYGFTCALLDDHTVKCWGYSADGQLGQENTVQHGNLPGTMGDTLPAIRLGTGRTVNRIATGLSFACALLDDNTVKCWGTNGGQLGQGDTNNRGNTPGTMGDALLPLNLGTARTARGLSGSASSMCAVLDDRTLKCWGGNGSGALGLGDTNPRGNIPGTMGDMLARVTLGTGRTVTGFSFGGYATGHGCARLDNGAFKCWGANMNGELGLGDANNRGDNLGEMGDTLPAVTLE